MRSFRRITTSAVIALVFFAFQSTYAQGMRMSPAERAEQLAKRLDLNEEQKAQVTRIYESSQNNMREKMPNLMGDREAMRKAMQEVTVKTDKEIEKILTKEQLKKYSEWKKEREKQMRQRMQGRRDGN